MTNFNCLFLCFNQCRTERLAWKKYHLFSDSRGSRQGESLHLPILSRLCALESAAFQRKQEVFSFLRNTEQRSSVKFGFSVNGNLEISVKIGLAKYLILNTWNCIFWEIIWNFLKLKVYLISKLEKLYGWACESS